MPVVLHADDSDALPAHAVAGPDARSLRGARQWPAAVDREWAFGGATGAGATVCVVDSGVDGGHPLVGGVSRSIAIRIEDDETHIDEDESGDVCGHGTACAGIIRSVAPDCELVSVRVLGEGFVGSGPALIEGLRWAVEQGFDVINMSLSTTKERFVSDLHALTDAAYFRRSLIVASAHNMPIPSWPWRFASVLSVASHSEADPEVFFHNPHPPVEFHARGMDVEVAWAGGATIRASGNSFATPHMAGMAARVLGAHPGLRPFEIKTALHLSADNVKGDG